MNANNQAQQSMENLLEEEKKEYYDEYQDAEIKKKDDSEQVKDPDLKKRLGSLEAIPEEKVSAIFTPGLGILGNS